MQAGQAFLRGVGRLQAVLLATLRAVPGLAGVVHPPDVVGAWRGGMGASPVSRSLQKSWPPAPPRPAPESLGLELRPSTHGCQLQPWLEMLPWDMCLLRCPGWGASTWVGAQHPQPHMQRGAQLASAPSKTHPGAPLQDASLQDPAGITLPRGPHRPQAIMPTDRGCSQRPAPPPQLCLSPTATPPLTYLVAQHPLQPVLPGSGQVDGQRRPAVLHHHHCLGQEVISKLHHHLRRKEANSVSTPMGGDGQRGLGSKQRLRWWQMVRKSHQRHGWHHPALLHHYQLMLQLPTETTESRSRQGGHCQY